MSEASPSLFPEDGPPTMTPWYAPFRPSTGVFYGAMLRMTAEEARITVKDVGTTMINRIGQLVIIRMEVGGEARVEGLSAYRIEQLLTPENRILLRVTAPDCPVAFMGPSILTTSATICHAPSAFPVDTNTTPHNVRASFIDVPSFYTQPLSVRRSPTLWDVPRRLLLGVVCGVCENLGSGERYAFARVFQPLACSRLLMAADDCMRAVREMPLSIIYPPDVKSAPAADNGSPQNSWVDSYQPADSEPPAKRLATGQI